MELGNFKGYPDQTIPPAPGRILVSEPFLNDNYFKRAVVLITEHNEEGSIGFILNKPIEISLHEVMADSPVFDGLVLMGGPVGRDTLHFIHTMGDQIKGSRKIIEGLYWGGDFDKVKELIQDGKIYPDEIKFFVGYSGWSPNQLEQEIKQHAWFVLPGQIDYIMNHDTSHLWHKILKDQGNDYAEFANYPVDPMLN
jgi:putative transcriptional regulator